MYHKAEKLLSVMVALEFNKNTIQTALGGYLTENIDVAISKAQPARKSMHALQEALHDLHPAYKRSRTNTRWGALDDLLLLEMARSKYMQFTTDIDYIAARVLRRTEDAIATHRLNEGLTYQQIQKIREMQHGKQLSLDIPAKPLADSIQPVKSADLYESLEKTIATLPYEVQIHKFDGGCVVLKKA